MGKKWSVEGREACGEEVECRKKTGTNIGTKKEKEGKRKCKEK